MRYRTDLQVKILRKKLHNNLRERKRIEEEIAAYEMIISNKKWKELDS